MKAGEVAIGPFFKLHLDALTKLHMENLVKLVVSDVWESLLHSFSKFCKCSVPSELQLPSRFAGQLLE